MSRLQAGGAERYVMAAQSVLADPQTRLGFAPLGPVEG